MLLMSMLVFTLALAIIPLLVTAIMSLLAYAEYNDVYSFMDRGFEEILEIRKKKRPRFLILISLMFINVVYCLVFIVLIFAMVPSPDNVQERAIIIAIALMGSGAILSTIAMKWAITRVAREMVHDPDIDYKGKTRKQINELRKEDLFGRRLIEVVMPHTLAVYGMFIAVMILTFCMAGTAEGGNGTDPESLEEPTINAGNIDDVEVVGLLIAFSYIPSMMTGIIPKWVKGDIRSGSVFARKLIFGMLGSLPTVISFSIFIAEMSS